MKRQGREFDPRNGQTTYQKAWFLFVPLCNSRSWHGNPTERKHHWLYARNVPPEDGGQIANRGVELTYRMLLGPLALFSGYNNTAVLDFSFCSSAAARYRLP